MAFREAIKPFLGCVTELMEPVAQQPSSGFLEMPRSLAQQLSLGGIRHLRTQTDQQVSVSVRQF